MHHAKARGPTTAEAERGPSGAYDLPGRQIEPVATTQADFPQLHGRADPRDQPLELLLARCCILADRVAAGEIAFLDAVDMAWTAAEFAGTVDRVGPDAVQAVLALAFMGARKDAA